MADIRVLRWRAQLAVSAAIVVGLWWLYTGGPTYVIQIDYQWIAEMADSAEVVIDGEVVGTLEYNPRSAYLAYQVAITYRALRRWDRAEHYNDRSIELAPDVTMTRPLDGSVRINW